MRKAFSFWVPKINPVELQGVRIGISDIDYEVMAWIKALFYPRLDGIIAPQMESPFHDQGSADQELVLFTPNACLEWLCDRPLTPRVVYHHLTVPFSQAFAIPTFTDSLTPHIRHKSPRRDQQGGKGHTQAPTIKDAQGDAIASHPPTRAAYEKQVRAWMRGIRKLQAKCPWIMDVQVCLPLAFVQGA